MLTITYHHLPKDDTTVTNVTVDIDIEAGAELTGTDKQIAWAKSIRHAAVQRIVALIHDKTRKLAGLSPSTSMVSREDADTGLVKAREQLDQINAAIAAQTDAAWWIDNRETFENSGLVVPTLVRAAS